MDQQAQDRLWKELSEESQNKLREMAGLNLIEGHYLIKDFEKLFGSHNLNPKPIKKEGWVNIFATPCGIKTGYVYPTKESALNCNELLANRIDTVKIRWEE